MPVNVLSPRGTGAGTAVCGSASSMARSFTSRKRKPSQLAVHRVSSPNATGSGSSHQIFEKPSCSRPVRIGSARFSHSDHEEGTGGAVLPAFEHDRHPHPEHVVAAPGEPVDPGHVGAEHLDHRLAVEGESGRKEGLELPRFGQEAYRDRRWSCAGPGGRRPALPPGPCRGPVIGPKWVGIMYIVPGLSGYGMGPSRVWVASLAQGALSTNAPSTITWALTTIVMRRRGSRPRVDP